MKEIFTFATWLIALGSVSLRAEAVIALNNYGPSSNPIYWHPGKLVPKEMAYAQLIYEGSPVIDAATRSSVISFTDDERFFGGVGIAPNLPDFSASERAIKSVMVPTRVWATARLPSLH